MSVDVITPEHEIMMLKIIGMHHNTHTQKTVYETQLADELWNSHISQSNTFKFKHFGIIISVIVFKNRLTCDINLDFRSL